MDTVIDWFAQGGEKVMLGSTNNLYPQNTRDKISCGSDMMPFSETETNFMGTNKQIMIESVVSNEGFDFQKEGDSKSHLNPGEQRKVPTRRCIVVTVCVSKEIIDLDDSSISSLCSAILSLRQSLLPSDYICFNIGNSSRHLYNDK